MGKGAKTKGYFKNLKTGELKKFMFNPSEIEYDRQSTINELSSPGLNYPFLVYSKASSKGFSVDLFLHGKDTKSHINFLEKLLPSKSKTTSSVTHPLAYFVMGSTVRKVVVNKVRVKETMWDKDLKPTEATVSISMTEVVQ